MQLINLHFLNICLFVVINVKKKKKIEKKQKKRWIEGETHKNNKCQDLEFLELREN